MLVVHYPAPQFRTRKQEGRSQIFDGLRRRWIALTPEEWVRQNLLNWLIVEAGIPATMIAQEKEIRVGELRKRFDALVYDGQHRPWMMIECKAPTVPLNDEVLYQLLRYHASVPVPYLLVSNGDRHLAWEKRDGVLREIDSIPGWLA